MKITVPLWDHQTTIVDFAAKSLDRYGYAWWLAGCATGKTLASYALMEKIGAKKTLVLTKKTIIDQAWVENVADKVEDVIILPLLEGSSKEKAATLLSYKKFHMSKPMTFIVNYETASLISDCIENFGFDLVIADESHKLKSHNSKQSRNLAAACRNIPNKLIMTGTGWDDRPTDVYGQVRFLASTGRGTKIRSTLLGYWTEFFKEYVNYRNIGNIMIPISYKNIDQLRGIIDPFTIYLDSETCLTLPKELDIVRELEWTYELRKAYSSMEKEMIATYRGDHMIADNVLVQATRLHQLTGGYYNGQKVKEYIATPKIDTVVDLLDEIGKHPTVIFTAFETDVAALEETLRDKGYEVLKLVGGTYQHEEFQNGEGDVILVNLAAGNAGIELTRARYVIYYSIGTSRTNYTQSRWRVRRPSSSLQHPITYYHLVLPQSMDTLLRDAMKAKGRVSDALIAGLKTNDSYRV